MCNCSDEVTTEEYAAHFDAVLHSDYPQILHYKDRDYVMNVKEFKYAAKGSMNEKHFLRVEIWDTPQEKIQMMILLIKSDGCRFHSPVNPNFDIRPELMGTTEGAYLLKILLNTLSKFEFSFLVEEIYGEDVGYDMVKRSYNTKRYALLREFYTKLGFVFRFDRRLGRGYVVFKNGKLVQNEEKCLNNVIARILAKRH